MFRSFVTRGLKRLQRDSAKRDRRIGFDVLESRIALAVDFGAESKFRSFDWAFKSAVSYNVSLVDTAKNRNASASSTLMLRGSSSWTSATDGTSTVSGTARGNGTGEFLVEIEPGNFQWLPGSVTYSDSISGDGQGTFTDAKLSANVSVTGTANVTLPIVGGGSASYTESMSLSATGSLVSQTYPHQVPLTVYDSRIVGGEIKLMPSIITTNDTGTFDFGVSGKMQSKKHSFEMKVTGKHPNVADPATPIGRVRLGYSTDKTRSGIIQEINLTSEESAIYWNTATVSLSASSPNVRRDAPTDAKYVVAYVDNVASGITEKSQKNNVFALPLSSLEILTAKLNDIDGSALTLISAGADNPYFGGNTRIHGTVSLKGDTADALQSMQLEIVQNGNVVAKADLSSSARQQLVKSFGPKGTLSIKTQQLLFELPVAQAAGINVSQDGNVSLRIKASSQNEEEATKELGSVGLLARYTAANRYGPRDEAQGGDDWALPSTLALMQQFSGVTWGDMSNMNGGKFSPHKTHLSGKDVDGYFAGYEKRDAAAAAMMIAYLNSPNGSRIATCWVTFNARNGDAFYDAIRSVTLNDGRSATSVIKPLAGHTTHFHWQFV